MPGISLIGPGSGFSAGNTLIDLVWELQGSVIDGATAEANLNQPASSSGRNGLLTAYQGTQPTSVLTGGAVSVEIALDNTTGFQQVYFPSEFRNLLSVQWQQGDNVTNNPHMFDNVVLSTAE